MKSFVKKINRGFTPLNTEGLGFKAKNLTGFTMIEMVVVMAIVVVMSMALFANYREIGDQGRVTSFTSKIREDMYLAQNYSSTGRTNKYSTYGWGLYFNRGLSKYIIFSDLDGDKVYSYPVKLLIHGNETPSGGTFTDSSQSANTITVTGAQQRAAVGAPSTSGEGFWDFDGDRDSLAASSSINFDFASGDFTIDLWASSTTDGTSKYLMSKGSGADKSYELYKNAANKIVFTLYDENGNPYTMTSRDAIAVNTWTHITVIKFHNNNSYVTALFFNGQTQDKKLSTTTVKSVASNLTIGADNDGSSTSWEGGIDEIRISKGMIRWRELFNTPTKLSEQSDEFFREIKLPPGVVFDSLSLGGVLGLNELNIFFDLSPNLTSGLPTHLMYGNGNSGDQEARIIINNAGVADTGIAGDTPQTLIIDKSGAINWTH